MKKLSCALLVILLVLACLLPASAQSAQRKLTLMIYMCGSNLESSYGSASADLQEMIAAAPGMTDVSVLIMNGGSARWNTGYDASQLQISELGRRGMRVVWRDETASMGVPQTLTQLLRFGVEKYPAEDYALILWDHGGGPLEGVCWDELFSMDNLRLAELTEALEAAPLPGKLSWIGFDACLMSSLEVAGALAPYAEYMIASQETEPAFGWNYSFLSDPGKDQSGADTGRRIVDAYFDGRDDVQDVLTLACLDLSKTEAAAKAVDDFFSQSGTMNHELFNAVSGVRMNATGFGKGLRGFDDDGYDLVDLADLTQRLSPLMTDAAPLQQALQELVCYSRANIDAANGVSIYHPYMNKSKFTAGWKEDYAQLSLSPRYAAYVRQFGAWLTGEALTDWSGLHPVSLGFNEHGKEELTLQLSPEQRADFASAQLIILKEFSANNRIYSLIGTVPAYMDENGTLNATANWYSLYALDSNDDLGGPISYMLTADTKQIVREVRFGHPGNKIWSETLPVLYYLNPPSGNEDAIISQIRVYDQATGTYTNRIAVDESIYAYWLMADSHVRLPESDDNKPLPDFFTWEEDNTGILAYLGDPALPWHFIWKDEVPTDDSFIALFSITDTQQNTYCSQPIDLQRPHRRPFTGSLASAAIPDLTVELSGYVATSEYDAGMHIDFTFTNHAAQAIEFAINSLTLDNSRFVGSLSCSPNSRSVLEPNASTTISATLNAEQLIGMTDIASVSMALSYYADASSYKKIPLEYSFQLDHCNVEEAAAQYPILAQAEKDGVTWTLLNVSPSQSGGYTLLFQIDNNSAQPLNVNPQILINGIDCGTSSIGGFKLPPNTSAIEDAWVQNDLFSSLFRVVDETFYLGGYMLSRHIQQGYGNGNISHIIVFNPQSKSDASSLVTLQPHEALEVVPIDILHLDGVFAVHHLPDEEVLALDKLLTLLDHPAITIKLERILVGEKGIAMVLHLTNHSDQVHEVKLDDVVISGAAYECYGADASFTVVPHTASVVYADLGGRYSDQALTDTVDNLEFVINGTFTLEDHRIQAIVTEPAPFAHPGGVYILPKNLRIITQQPVATPTAIPK